MKKTGTIYCAPAYSISLHFLYSVGVQYFEPRHSALLFPYKYHVNVIGRRRTSWARHAVPLYLRIQDAYFIFLNPINPKQPMPNKSKDAGSGTLFVL